MDNKSLPSEFSEVESIFLKKKLLSEAKRSRTYMAICEVNKEILLLFMVPWGN